MTTPPPGSREAAQALAETLRKAAQKWASELLDKPPYWEALAAAALAPEKPEPTFPEIEEHEYTFGKGKSAPPADGAGEVEAEIRARHEYWKAGHHLPAVSACADRAVLLALLDEERARRVEVEGALGDLVKSGLLVIEYLDDMPDLDDDVYDDFDRALTDARATNKDTTR